MFKYTVLSLSLLTIVGLQAAHPSFDESTASRSRTGSASLALVYPEEMVSQAESKVYEAVSALGRLVVEDRSSTGGQAATGFEASAGPADRQAEVEFLPVEDRSSTGGQAARQAGEVISPTRGYYLIQASRAVWGDAPMSQSVISISQLRDNQRVMMMVADHNDLQERCLICGFGLQFHGLNRENAARLHQLDAKHIKLLDSESDLRKKLTIEQARDLLAIVEAEMLEIQNLTICR